MQNAAGKGHLQTVTLLLDRGANPWSAQALRIAIRNHHDAIVGVDLIVALLLTRRGEERESS